MENTLNLWLIHQYFALEFEGMEIWRIQEIINIKKTWKLSS